MHLKDSLFSSFKNIVSHFMRSLLTLLGISIGVFAVVTMFASVYGLKNMIQERMEGLGWNNSLMIQSGSQTDNNWQHRRRRNRFWTAPRIANPLSVEDFNYLEETISHKHMYGMIETWTRLYTQNKTDHVQLRATHNDYFITQTFPLKSGRYFNNLEMNNGEKVCVVGFHFAEEYFPKEDPVGKIITAGNHRYKIIGVLNKDILNDEGFSFNPWGRRWDLKAVYIPLTTGAKYLKSDHALDYIYMQSHNEEGFGKMKDEINQTMLMLHRMNHDFSFNDIGSELLKVTEEINDIMKKWNVTLFAIASISLIVGGIGLFSTLLISISERMMEIGIRKSLGATNLDIFLLFIAEAVLLAIIAAGMGILSSSGIISVISKFTNFDFPIPMQGITLGFGFAIVIGLLSGLYPAIKAAKIDPIKAIYYQD